MEMQIAAADTHALWRAKVFILHSIYELFHSVLILSIPTERMTNILQLDASFNFWGGGYDVVHHLLISFSWLVAKFYTRGLFEH